MLHHVGMNVTHTTTTELSVLTDLDLPVEIWIPSWMTNIPDTEINSVNMIFVPIGLNTAKVTSSYILLFTMLDKIQTGADLKTCINAADDLNEFYTAYDIEIDHYKGRWIMMIDCHPTRVEIVVDLNDLVKW